MRVNVGCGHTPIKGWLNIDNSISVLASRIPGGPALLRLSGLRRQSEFATAAKRLGIRYGQATKLPIGNDSADAVYSCHMLEHMSRSDSLRFLNEAHKVLRAGGVFRLVVPDLRDLVNRYLERSDGDYFMEESQLTCDLSLKGRLRLLASGPRHHQWLHDEKSILRLFERSEWQDFSLMPFGKTRIPNPQGLNLHERADCSLCVEAVKIP